MVNILKHPLIEHKLGIIRNKNTSTKEFRETVSEIASLLTYEITRNLALREKIIETPIAKCKVYELKDEILIIPILRAGLGMVNGIQNLIPNAKVGHIGLYRDEKTLKPQQYYAKFPDNMQNSTVLLLDPMLATGNSTIKAIEILKEKGMSDIIFVGLVGSTYGIENIKKHHPDIKIYLAALDEKLDENGYITPGLGDAGDRLFGTK